MRLALALLVAAVAVIAGCGDIRQGQSASAQSTQAAVLVPDLTGMSIDEAIALLCEAGLEPDLKTQPLPDLTGDQERLLGTRPPAGSEVPPGSTVVVDVGISEDGAVIASACTG